MEGAEIRLSVLRPLGLLSLGFLCALSGATIGAVRLAVNVLLVLYALAAPAAAQEQPSPSAANPLAALYDELGQALAAAGVPFSEEQQRAITLMMEDRRRASEDLFGDLMDFRQGPTQGQEEDRLRSAIEWMRSEFSRNVAGYLTDAQAVVWKKLQSERLAAASTAQGAEAEQAQTQYVRINNNAFTAENGGFDDGNFTEVIPRGGAGAWHGNAQFLLKDDALNARNALAGNEPPYQERRLSVDVSGPAIPRRLTTSLEFNSVESKNVSTVKATLPDGEFALGITRPSTFRQLSSRSTLQLADPHSLGVSVSYALETADDQGVGDFTLPERASDSEWRSWNAEITQFSSLTAASIFEARFGVYGSLGETIPLGEDVRINVLDAFNGGGAQNRLENEERAYNFNTMYTRSGGAVTIKTGFEGSYLALRTVSTNNFGGTFTFSSLDDYLAGTPINYRVTRGNPLLRTTQLDASAFVQVDASVTAQLTLMFGLRYGWQTNLDDFNNLSPRVSFGYSPGKATVIRGGAGLFYNGLHISMVENQRRFDGTRQFEIVVDNPSYPDPFASGTIRQTFPSIRVTDPGLQAPELLIAMVSVERTFFSNLLITGSYDHQHEFHRMRVRNLNAPFDATSPILRACQSGQPQEECPRPDPARGNVISLESSGREVRHNFEISARKRFSVFNVSAEYGYERVFGDVQGAQGAAVADNYDVRADWGRAPFPAHEVEVTVNARLPLGVFVTGQMDANSGRYYTITTGLDDNRDGNVTDRPPGIPPNSLRGPKYMDFDFNISKAFFFRASGTGPNINVFANMTNAFNHVHYGTPSGVLTSPNFGRSTSADDAREIEAGVRFQF
jgi:hypothetical protein